MSEKFVPLIPYILSFLISSTVGGVTYLRRKEHASIKWFSALAFSQASWTFGYMFELWSDTRQGKIFWDNFQFFGTFLWPVFLYAFMRAFINKPIEKNFVWWLIALPGAITTLLAYTDSWHGLIRPEISIIPGTVFDELSYSFTSVIWAFYIFYMPLLIISLGGLLSNFYKHPSIYRTQIILVTLGNMIPFIGSNLIMFGITLSFHRDTTPLTFAISNLIVLYAIFGWEFLNIFPITNEQIVEEISEGIVILNAKEDIIKVNPKMKQLFNLDCNVTGEQFSRSLGQYVQLAQLSETPFEIHLEKEKRFIELSRSEINLSNLTHSGSFILAKDITKQKESELELKTHAEKLEAANEELSAFAHSISHDLRAPVRATLGFSEILKQELTPALNTEQKQYLERLIESGQTMNEMINGMLELSNITQKEFTLREVNFSKIAESILLRLQSANPERKVEFEVEPDMRAFGDHGMIQILFENLIGNAWKFTNKIELSLIKIGTEQKENQIIFYVKDNGVGFDSKWEDKLFQPFQRLHSNTEFKGTGIGLATVSRIIKRHKGKIWAASAPGEGATFYFTIKG